MYTRAGRLVGVDMENRHALQNFAPPFTQSVSAPVTLIVPVTTCSNTIMNHKVCFVWSCIAQPWCRV